MKKLLLILIIIILSFKLVNAGLVINEIACATSGDDWVELYYYENYNANMDISNLFVTMYYGTNEPLSTQPVTIYNYDRPETGYDDRYVVVHLTEQFKEDETDYTGDTNKNGYIDIYCNNYSNSLWNTDCIVAIDTDDDPSNGGIIDFAAYSTRDGEINDTIGLYVESAQNYNQWQVCAEANIQNCMIDIGPKGLSTYLTISRKQDRDTNKADDFEITKFMTPGKGNVFTTKRSGRNKLFKTIKKKLTFIPSHQVLGKGNIDIFIYEPCNIRLRIFSSIGMLLYESPLNRDVHPGSSSLYWNFRGKGKRVRSGLYIGYIEAVNKTLKKNQVEKIYIIISR